LWSDLRPKHTSKSPKTGRLRFFIGAYNVLLKVISRCLTFLAPLDDTVASRQSNAIITWSDDLRTVFHAAQHALSTNRSISLPRPGDLLWIVNDAAVRKPGIDATLYVSRRGQLLVCDEVTKTIGGCGTDS